MKKATISHTQSSQKQPFFKPLQQPLSQLSNNAKVRSNEMEIISTDMSTDQTSQERLTGLHAKLHLEADKIRKWKLQTETELRQKDQEIQEGKQRITSQRNSLLELQLQNENLSLKLQNALENREELSEKFNNNMDRIMALKSFAETVHSQFKTCETSCDELVGIQDEYRSKFQTLNDRYAVLKKAATNRLSALKLKMTQDKEDSEKREKQFRTQLSVLEQEKVSLTQQTSEKDELIQSLSDQINDIKQELISAQSSLREMKVQAADLESLRDQLKKDFEETSKSLSDMKMSKEKLEEDLSMTTKCLVDIQEQKEVLAKDLTEAKTSHKESCTKFKEDLGNLEGENNSFKDRNEALEKELQCATSLLDDLKTSKDMLTVDKNNLKEKLDSLEAEKASLEEVCRKAAVDNENLLAAISSNESKIQDLTGKHNLDQSNIKDLETQISTLQNHLTAAQKELAELTSNLELKEAALKTLETQLNEVETQKKEANERLQELERKLNDESTEQGDLIDKMEQLKIEKTSIQKELTGNKKEASKISKELDKYKRNETKLKQQVKDQSEQISQLREELKEGSEKLAQFEASTEEKIQQELSNTSYLKDELDQKVKLAADLESKFIQSKTELTNKNKLIKELEKEAKSLKAKLEAKEKLGAGMESDISDLNDVIKEKQKEICSLQSELKSSKTSLSANEKKLQQKTKEAEKAKELEAKSKKEKLEASKLFDDQLNAMVATLDEYKRENQKTVDLKEKEIVDMKSRLEQEYSKKTTSHEQVIKELNDFKAKYESAMVIQQELQKCCDSEKERYAKLKEELRFKLKENAELQSDVEKMKADAQRTSGLEKELKKLQNEGCSLKAKCCTLEESLNSSQARCKDLELNLSRNSNGKCYESGGGDGRVDPTPPTRKSIMRRATPKIAATAPVTPPQNQKAFVPSTPMSAKTKILAKTPSQSVLLRNKLMNKKRRVAFASDEDHDDSDDSSSSELMEIEIENSSISTLRKSIDCQPSPRIRACFTPKAQANKKTFTPKAAVRAPVKPLVPQRQGASAGQSKKLKTAASKPTEEMQKFKELYPASTSEKANTKKTPSNIRKATAKSPGRFFKSSPLEKKKNTKVSEEEGLAWFEADAVFGFGSDD